MESAGDDYTMNLTPSRVRLSILPLMGLIVGCNDLSGIAGKQALPSGIPDPSVYHTAAGAMALYQTAIATVQGYNGSSASHGVFASFILHVGLLTDELTGGNDQGCVAGCTSAADSEPARQLPEGRSLATDALYGGLQEVRGSANQAIAALAAYDDSAPTALRGELYALEGYATIFLADFFCSGVPLSTLDFNGDFTYRAGSTTQQLYLDAIAKFDTALALSADSVRILNLARVGKGRAWLDLGQYDSAAASVTSVPVSFTYQFLVDWSLHPLSSSVWWAKAVHDVTVTDHKGRNGLPFLTNQDPRTSSQIASINQYGVPQYVPSKYGGATPGVALTVMADWIEARLIQAEAALHGVPTGAGSWLDQLNTLRQTAITPSLPPLSDPGDSPGDSARVSLLFQERAYWLFATGHRQGDLRRLIREYGRSVIQVYPFGLYSANGQTLFYSTNVSAPIPSTEASNPLFHGCLSRGA